MREVHLFHTSSISSWQVKAGSSAVCRLHFAFCICIVHLGFRMSPANPFPPAAVYSF